ncbi:hypothetical protein NC653_004903 [Populus alba x Populus x berolinensis]|uniref:Uncharacterized protein n=1 Tax=Populus alba x Populus x berolinensis TaxID=444605 RepID=A0AAD6RAL7_9ROSI|nr:hypothetical protein NC653_004903 [Populus alba x Populus x berolinensis]
MADVAWKSDLEGIHPKHHHLHEKSPGMNRFTDTKNKPVDEELELKSLQQASINETGIQFPFKEATVLITKNLVGGFVVTDDMVPSNTVEEAEVVLMTRTMRLLLSENGGGRGCFTFMAKCLVAKPEGTGFSYVVTAEIDARGGCRKVEYRFQDERDNCAMLFD